MAVDSLQPAPDQEATVPSALILGWPSALILGWAAVDWAGNTIRPSALILGWAAVDWAGNTIRPCLSQIRRSRSSWSPLYALIVPAAEHFPTQELLPELPEAR